MPSDEQPSTEMVPAAAEVGISKAVANTKRPAGGQLVSEKIVVSAPLSFAGSAERIWKLTKIREEMPYRIMLGVCSVVLISATWVVVLAWYVVFGLLLVPYRLIRRGQRKRKRESAMHRETLEAIERNRI